MTAAITTQAGTLARTLLSIRDRSERMEAVAAVCDILADALSGTDAHTPLDEAASNARAEAEFWSQPEAKPSLLGRHVERMFQPEEV